MSDKPQVTTRQKLAGLLWVAIALGVVIAIVKWSPSYIPELLRLIPGMTDF